MLDDRDYMRANTRQGNGGSRRSTGEEGGLFSTVTGKIIAINVVIFLLENFQSSPPGQGVNDRLALLSNLFNSLELWRLVTYMFAHGSLMHIAFNMWALYLMGSYVERALGAVRYVSLYAFSGILGGLLWLLLNHGGGAVIGASGAVMGIMAAAAMLFPDMRVMLLFPPIPMRLPTMVILLAVFDFWMEWQHWGGQVAHLAHLGGLAGGLGYCWYLKRRAARPQSRRPHPRPPILTKVEPIGSENESKVDQILDKIGKHGMASLTPEEKRILDEQRDRLRG